ncbi:hypothetical protein VTJ83DRAFT_4235 [Remersonia thermophila]|uniref:Uncharacterized protein n=1 Tax=Remersonia thermophila TaxID=72144 RepID=A0ABR4D9E3_9PEZI
MPRSSPRPRLVRFAGSSPVSPVPVPVPVPVPFAWWPKAPPCLSVLRKVHTSSSRCHPPPLPERSWPRRTRGAGKHAGSGSALPSAGGALEGRKGGGPSCARWT